MRSWQTPTGERRETGTVYGLGRNFAAHAREMNATTEPVVFLMPRSALLEGGGVVRRPEGCRDLHHEVELVLFLGAGGVDLDPAAAAAAIEGVAIGVDLTARDLQGEAKKKGAPWARAKGFDGAAPVGAVLPAAPLRNRWSEIDLRLEVDGERRQDGRCEAMLHDPPQVVALLSRWFRLEPGDVIFTGTPEGVGPLQPGQRARAFSECLDTELLIEIAG